MIVEFGEFKIVQSIGFNKFDLSRVTISKSGKSEGKELERNIAYGVTIERVFMIILDEATVENKEGLKVTLDKYLQIYQEVGEQVKQEIRRIEVTLDKR
tara:strand:- start:25751 stop:26047 length:297 start_codon:yes stop_codon:yes gene_type:complete